MLFRVGDGVEIRTGRGPRSKVSKSISLAMNGTGSSQPKK